MELRHIRYFLAVANELNFTRAADKLCIAQPPLSRQIQDLEEELGVKLFLRKPHALQLTEEGILYKQYAEKIMELVDKSKEDVQEIENGLQGTLYLATVEGGAPRIISEWIAGFRKEYPKVQYQLWNGNSDDVINQITKGLCELAIIAEPHNAEGVEAVSICSEPWIAMIPKHHPLAAEPGDEIDLEKLLPYDLIIPSRASRLQEITSWFQDGSRKPIIRCRIAHMMNAYELTRHGVGITIFPASAQDIAAKDQVVIKRLANPSVMASYVLIWNKGRALSRVAEEFLAYVRQTLTE